MNESEVSALAKHSHGTQTKEKRLVVFDVLKIIGMSYILFGHVLQRWYVIDFTKTVGFSIFYSVSLALFFFVGGHFIKRSTSLIDLLLYLLRLFVSYIIPAYLFTCLSIWLLPRFSGHDFTYWMGELYYRTDTFYWFFLTAFFVNASLAIAEYIAHIVFKSKRESLSRDIWKTVVVIIILVSLTLPFIYIYNDPNLGPSVLSANMFLYYLPIAFVGFLYKTYGKYFELFKRIHLVRWITASVALVIYIITLIKFPNWLGGLNGSFIDIAYHMIGSLSGVIFYYYLALAIQNLKFVRQVSSFAKYSGPFYLVHVFLIRLLASYLPRPEIFDSSAILFIVFLTIGFYFGSMVITIILVKFPISDIILFGDVKRMISVYSLVSRKNGK